MSHTKPKSAAAILNSPLRRTKSNAEKYSMELESQISKVQELREHWSKTRKSMVFKRALLSTPAQWARAREIMKHLDQLTESLVRALQTWREIELDGSVMHGGSATLLELLNQHNDLLEELGNVLSPGASPEILNALGNAQQNFKTLLDAILGPENA